MATHCRFGLHRPVVFTIIIAVVWCAICEVTAHSNLPEASSTLLKMHRLYTRQPPHDASLYDVLGVSPNATSAEITKSYRRLTRKLHPDKNPGLEERLEKVREAYEVLKDDATRLPYHKYGLMDLNMAALILTGSGNSVPSPEEHELLRLMGFDGIHRGGRSATIQRRVMFIAVNLLERIRPLVEGAVSEATLANAVAQECDRLKKLPLGAQVIRCVGRAYKHSGQKLLRRHHMKQSQALIPLRLDVPDTLEDTYRDAKHFLTAALAGGRFVLKDKIAKRKSSSYAMIEHNRNDPLEQLIGEEDVDLSSLLRSSDEIKADQVRKAQRVLLDSLQVEALWKISKIELYRTVRDACRVILTGNFFFFPSHQSIDPQYLPDDGWVGSTGETVDAEVGRIRAAAALVMIGNVMVKCSKDGTSWME